MTVNNGRPQQTTRVSGQQAITRVSGQQAPGRVLVTPLRTTAWPTLATTSSDVSRSGGSIITRSAIRAAVLSECS